MLAKTRAAAHPLRVAAVIIAILASVATAQTKKVALITLEKSAYEAWKSKDAKFWDTFLSDKFVGWGSFGPLNKASAIKEYTRADCEVKSYALSDEQVSWLGKDAALVTYKATVDGACGGQKLPTNSWAAGVYAREDANWKRAFFAQAEIVDPKATLAKPSDRQQAFSEDNVQPTNRDALTDSMLAMERSVWEAWRAHDTNKLADLTAEDISFINILGVHLATKADAMQDWSGTYCDVKSVSINRRRGHDALPHSRHPDVQGCCRRHLLRSKGWTCLGHFGLRQVRRWLEMDLWH